MYEGKRGRPKGAYAPEIARGGRVYLVQTRMVEYFGFRASTQLSRLNALPGSPRIRHEGRSYYNIADVEAWFAGGWVKDEPERYRRQKRELQIELVDLKLRYPDVFGLEGN